MSKYKLTTRPDFNINRPVKTAKDVPCDACGAAIGKECGAAKGKWSSPCRQRLQLFELAHRYQHGS
jgi:hypothetical protein